MRWKRHTTREPHTTRLGFWVWLVVMMKQVTNESLDTWEKSLPSTVFFFQNVWAEEIDSRCHAKIQKTTTTHRLILKKYVQKRLKIDGWLIFHIVNNLIKRWGVPGKKRLKIETYVTTTSGGKILIVLHAFITFLKLSGSEGRIERKPLASRPTVNGGEEYHSNSKGEWVVSECHIGATKNRPHLAVTTHHTTTPPY